MKRILCIDGGGIRGIIPALILGQIEAVAAKPAWSLFDLIAGTSVGGITALALAKPNPMSAADMVEFYRSIGPKIFTHSFYRPLLNLGDLFGSKYGDSLVQPMSDMFGSAVLSDALAEVLVPAFEMTTYSPYFFKRHLAKDNADSNFTMKDVAVATASAPTYFEPHKIRNMVFVDGGLFATCPCTAALAEAIRLFPNETYCMLSLGTGRSASKYDNVHDWGLVRWARPLVDALMDATVDADVYKMQQFLQDSFLRIQPPLTATEAIMDDANSHHLDDLTIAIRNYIQHNQGTTEKMLKLLGL